MVAIDVKIVGYNYPLLQKFIEMNDFFSPEKSLEGEEYFADEKEKINLFKTALRWKNVPTKKSMLIPGIGTDCVGSVVGILTECGLLHLPASVLEGKKRVERDWNNDLMILNLRMQAFLCYVLLKCVSLPDHAFFPIVNPTSLMAGDILFSPYIMSVAGMLVPPHSCLMASDTKIISSDFSSSTLVIEDIQGYSFSSIASEMEEILKYPVTNSDGKPLSGVIFRCYHYSITPEYKKFKQELFSIFRDVLRKLKLDSYSNHTYNTDIGNRVKV